MSIQTDLAQLLDEQEEQILPDFKAIDSATIIYADGNWTLKDVIAHLTVWNEQGLNALLASLIGRSYPVMSEDLDAFNNRTVQERRNLSEEEVYDSWARARNNIKTTVSAMSSGQLETEFQLPWGQKGTAVEVVKGLIGHADEHYEDVMDVINQ
ncbi:MAG TPA: ClbS/DfsB family four-helix bundle protein [Anaerolineae bacterium]|nr:ClbS/DfsB family four-helix bundle protein [Anaerolineae bacterium]